MSYTDVYLAEAAEILRRLDTTAIEAVASLLVNSESRRRPGVLSGCRRQRGQLPRMP